MNCILAKCPHEKHRRCELLTECGAGYLLRLSDQPDGQIVRRIDNPTLRALENAKLVRVSVIDHALACVRAA